MWCPGSIPGVGYTILGWCKSGQIANGPATHMLSLSPVEILVLIIKWFHICIISQHVKWEPNKEYIVLVKVSFLNCGHTLFRWLYIFAEFVEMKNPPTTYMLQVWNKYL